jgi:hypothetical protein
MRTHQEASEKKSSAHNTFVPTPNPLASRPFAVQPKPEESERSHSTKKDKSAMPDFAILNPQGRRSLRVRPKLTLGQPGDKYEQEADQVAAQVVNQIHSPLPHGAANSGMVNRSMSPNNGVIQRLLYDETCSKLYVPAQWKNESEEITIESPNSPAVDQKKTVADYQREPVFIQHLGKHWGITPNTQIIELDDGERDGANLATAWKNEEFVIETKKAINSQFMWEAKLFFKEEISSEKVKEEIKLVIDNKANEVPIEHIQPGKNINDLSLLVRTSKETLNQRLDAIVTTYIDPLYYLYQLADSADITDDTKVKKTRKPVVNPVNFMDVDTSTKVPQGEINKSKVCVLLAEVYESIYGTQDRKEVWTRLQKLADSYQAKVSKLNLTPEELTNHTAIKKQTKEKIYDMIQQLHDVIANKDYGAYDLTKNVEKVRDIAGYKLIISGKFPWNELPQNLPEGFGMQAGQVYIIGIEGHTQAVKILQPINSNTQIDTVTVKEYFQPLNETTHNYNLDPFNKNIVDVYARK